MIRIDKPIQEPEVLRTRGRKRRGGMASLYTRFSDDYDRGKKVFTFDATIYGHRSVKKVLTEAQHDKCCYCEAKVTPVAYGDIEHFRPKGKVAEDDAHPGYYWLAYEWSNLLFACQKCNQRFKRAFFPLRNPSKRARSHHHDLSQEEPLLIHPADEDPEQHVGFYKQEAIPLNGSLRGEMTIDVLGLNREKLIEERLFRYRWLEILYRIIQHKDNVPQDILNDSEKELRDAVEDQAAFASMARSAIVNHFWLNGTSSIPDASISRRRA